MAKNELMQLRNRAHELLRKQDLPLPTPAVARHLFGPRRHELPETHAVVRTLLEDDPRFLQTHDGRWTVRGSRAVDVPLDDLTYAVVDLETSGSIIGVDEIIEIGVVVVRGGLVVQRFGSLVWSRRHIPPWVARLTGIRRPLLSGAPRFEEIAPTLVGLLEGAVFVAHDIRFDLPFLRWEFERRELAFPPVTGLCTLRLAQALWPELGAWSLSGLSETLGVGHDHPHRALADADAAAGILQRCLERGAELGRSRLEDLYLLDHDPTVPGRDLEAHAAES
ncbi:MAG: exonuclease domain-containing protein [Candidatus Krumholzibacteriia bacterium]